MKKSKKDKAPNSRPIAILAFALVLSTGLLASGIVYSNRRFSKPATFSQTNVLGAQRYNTEHISAKLISVTEQANTATPSSRVSVHAQIVNDQSEPLELSPLLQFSVLGDNGNQYSYTAEFIGDAIIGGTISAGDIFDEDLDFILPKNVEPVALRYVQYEDGPTIDISLR